ncbi:MAG: hypothetical protein BroJett041_19320 [Candidatus Jettenia caeni]|nr:MAG: hypothetical protein BroJett041_19320 [Candidatus Jettenia caeni]GJQ47350.1 MAG: hypothetical protein JETCAE04_31040 [Candidatus Jettenia caeni]
MQTEQQEVKNCTGKLLFEDSPCYLHPYRLGRNPKLKGTGNSKNFKKSSTDDRLLASKTNQNALGNGFTHRVYEHKS